MVNLGQIYKFIWLFLDERVRWSQPVRGVWSPSGTRIPPPLSYQTARRDLCGLCLITLKLPGSLQKGTHTTNECTRRFRGRKASEAGGAPHRAECGPPLEGVDWVPRSFFSLLHSRGGFIALFELFTTWGTGAGTVPVKGSCGACQALTVRVACSLSLEENNEPLNTKTAKNC